MQAASLSGGAGMSRLFFHVRQGDDIEPDLIGLDLTDAKTAQSAALDALHDLRD